MPSRERCSSAPLYCCLLGLAESNERDRLERASAADAAEQVCRVSDRGHCRVGDRLGKRANARDLGGPRYSRLRRGCCGGENRR
jgi:hypothetical protein